MTPVTSLIWKENWGKRSGEKGTAPIVYPPLPLPPFSYPISNFFLSSSQDSIATSLVPSLARSRLEEGKKERKRGYRCEKIIVAILEWTMVFCMDDTSTDLGQRRVVNGVARSMTSRGANPCNWVTRWFCHGRSYKRTRVVLPRFPRLFAWKRVPATSTRDKYCRFPSHPAKSSASKRPRIGLCFDRSIFEWMGR